MSGEDQKRFKDYLELERCIAEFQAEHAPRRNPSPVRSVSREQG